MGMWCNGAMVGVVLGDCDEVVKVQFVVLAAGIRCRDRFQVDTVHDIGTRGRKLGFCLGVRRRQVELVASVT